MSDLELLHRAWFGYGAGLVALGLTALQLWSGKSIEKGPRVISRAKRPLNYWLNVILTGCMSVCFVGVVLPRIIASREGPVAIAAAILAFLGVVVLAIQAIRKNIHERAEFRKPMVFAAAATTNAGDSISVSGWTRPELDRILTDFLNAYDPRDAPAVNVNTVPNNFSVVSFPQGIAPDILLYLVNYIQYPKHFDLKGRTIGVLGRAISTTAFGPAPALSGRHVTIYVPSDDTDYDLVYAKVEAEGIYKISFRNMSWKPVHDARIPAVIQSLVTE